MIKHSQICERAKQKIMSCNVCRGMIYNRTWEATNSEKKTDVEKKVKTDVFGP